MRSTLVRNVLLGLLSAVLLALACDHRSPFLYRLRPAFPVLAVACVAAAAVGLWRRTWAHFAFSTIAVAALVIGCHREVEFQDARSRVLAAPPERLASAGEHLVVGYEDPVELERLVRRGAIAGIFLTTRNVRGRTVEEVRAFLDRLQVIQTAAGRKPLLVMADQEGGKVSRLSPPLPYLPPLAEYVSQAPDRAGRVGLAESYGAKQGAGLAALGVNVNLGPVLDLPVGDGPLLDPYSRIATRAISSDPEEAAALAVAYARGLESQGVRATLKHFPGLGRAPADTHFFRTDIPATLRDLEDRDWRPFRETIAATSSLVMVAHVVVPAVDAERIASTSPKVLDVLRGRLGHRGLVITDDLCMAPVSRGHGGIRAGAKAALAAGVDLLLVSYDGQQAYEVLDELLESSPPAPLPFGRGGDQLWGIPTIWRARLRSASQTLADPGSA